jgi:hypothetical protein
VLARAHHLQRGAGLPDREGQLDVALGQVAAHLVAGAAEDRQHGPVGRQHVRDEPLDPALAGSGGQVLEQHGPQATALLVVLHDEGHLGVTGPLQPVEADDADQVVVQRGDQRDPVVVVDLREAGDVGVGQRGR